MNTHKRPRRIFSVKEELLRKSREAALAAVQIFNSPNITSKSETYIVLMVVAWTYLLHASSAGERQRFRDRLLEAREELMDYSESTLREAVLAGQPWAVMFVLKTLGRNRGYGD